MELETKFGIYACFYIMHILYERFNDLIEQH